MNITRLDDAKPYEPELHHKVECLRLQGLEVSDIENYSVSLSYFLPGGGAEMSASPNEKVYVVLEGEITVRTEEQEYQLGHMDSCAIGSNTPRAIENRSNQVVTMLVVVSS